MAALSAKAVRKALERGEVAPVYYLTGEADLLKDELALEIVAAALEPGMRDFNLDVRAAADLDAEALHVLVETPPMLAARRAVVVRGLEQWRRNAKVWDELFRYLDRPSPTTTLILIHGAGEKPDKRLAAGATAVAIGPLKADHLAEWARRRAARTGLELEPAAADHLISAVGDDLGHLAMEIEKLAAAAGEGPMTVTDVAALVGVRSGETVFDWIDAVLARDTAHAVRLVDVVLPQAGVSGVRMVSALGTALVGVRLARALADTGAAAGRLEAMVRQKLFAARPGGLRRWEVEAAAWAGGAQRWTAPELDAAIRAAYEADRELKSTTLTDESGILVNMLLRLGARAEAA